MATGFLRNSMINEEGGIDPEQFRMEAMFDRMDAIGKSILGLTIQCAQCHNHKFDPLTQEEYYRMFAFLNDAHEATVAVYTPERADATRADCCGKIGEIEAELQHQQPDWPARMAAWEQQVRGNQPEWIVRAARSGRDPTGGSEAYLLEPDGSLLAAGLRPDQAPGEDDGPDRSGEHHGLSPGVAERLRTCRWAARAARSRAPAP